MHSRLLRSFLVVAEKQNLTEAATALHVSQPALTKSIQRLEEDLGVKLFDRISVGVRLTQYGDILQRHVKVMDNEYRHAVTQIDELRGGGAGVMRIGAGPVWLVSVLPPIIARFQSEVSGIKVSLIGGVIDTLVPALINGELDLICVSLDFPNRSEITKVPLFKIRHVLVADPAHPLLTSPEPVVDASLIQGYPWMVLKSDYVGTERISSFFAANGIEPPHIALETTSIHSLMQGLKGGHYIAHIPSQMLPLAQSTGLKQIGLRQTFWETTAGYAYRSSSTLSGALKRFTQLLSDTDFE